MKISLSNGNKFDLSNIREEIRITKKDEFLKKYDMHSDSIFDADELRCFAEDLIPYLKDGKLDREECFSSMQKLRELQLMH